MTIEDKTKVICKKGHEVRLEQGSKALTDFSNVRGGIKWLLGLWALPCIKGTLLTYDQDVD